ncbi:MAG: response regulator, partial [Lewinella sp.]|nr:response regulator [Lewinella sp.]
EKKQRELEKERLLNEKLRKTDKLKDEFLANTSHELRTPLNGIIGLAESLYEGVAGPLNPKAKQDLYMIFSSGKRLAGLVNSLLDFSKLKTHNLELDIKPLDLRAVADIILKINEPLVAGKKLELCNKIGPDIPPVAADENRLQQILHNLVGNAVKFTETGSITIGASVKNGMVEIAVADTGIGIPQDKLEDIFKSFEQADASITRKYGGTGLGLAISKQLVELHGGAIWADSQPGSGATFFFTLPVAGGAPEPSRQLAGLARVVELEEAAPAAPAPVAPEGEEKQFRILVVDDEPINQQVLANHLSFGHYAVVQAMNGAEALRALESGEAFDIVLLDIMMPRMSGYEVCRRIREKYLPSELPVIMITAKNQVSDLVQGLSLGANDYLAKPFSKNELLARIRTQLNLSKINSAYGRFVPYEFLHTLGRESILDVQLGDQVKGEVTILFLDIRDYTSLAEGMSPKDNFDFLNSFLSRIGPVIQQNHGYINQYFGDGLMALFQESPEDALRAGIEMQKAVQQYNAARRKKNRRPIRIGVGIHTGPLMLGIIGDERRMSASVVSDAVNTASRMEGLTKYFNAYIIVSEDTLERVRQPEQYPYRLLAKVKVLGKKEAVTIYEFFGGDPEPLPALKGNTKADFENGLAHYFL